MSVRTVTTRPCIACNKTTAVEMTEEEFNRYSTGVPVQYALPDWTPEEREMLISGTHSECWDRMFGSFDD